MSHERAIHFEGDRLRIPESAFDHDGFRAWVTSDEFPEGVHASWIDGEVFVEMSPESIESHNKVKTELTSAFVAVARELGETYADGCLFTNAPAGVSTEPDLTFVTWATLQSGRLRLNPRANRDDEWIEIEGAPDVVVEVVSDSSVRKDLIRLRMAYRKAGIPEYWIVDARGPDLRFEILVLEGDDYRPAAPAGAPQPSAVFAKTFSLSRRKNPVGRWTYDLTHV